MYNVEYPIHVLKEKKDFLLSVRAEDEKHKTRLLHAIKGLEFAIELLEEYLDNES